jgi:hypothetical protein
LKLGAALLRIDVGAQNGVHPGEMALAASAKPRDDVAVETEMNGSFAGRDDDAGGFPEAFSECLGFRSVDASLIESAVAKALDLAKGISHDSRFPVPLDLLSAR